MQPPLKETIQSNLSLVDGTNFTRNVSNYGNLTFISNTLQKLCNQKQRQEHAILVKMFEINCGTLKTTINLNKKLLNKRKEFEIGLQKFENPKMLFFQTVQEHYFLTE